SAPRTYYDLYTINLYYSNVTADGLQADRTTLSLSPDTTLEHAVLSRILTSSSSGKLKSAIPTGTRLNNVYVSEGVCYVDLSREFTDNVIHDELHEGMAVYSIVNTMTELPMINSVKFLIDGNSPDGYVHYRLGDSFTNNSELFSKNTAD
ncbi:MAG: GerMN domain-containing protein, partial [Oscillospiraceae bacterium]|nr:GerMN domain-containing protein [Oscillospiraceae bacterium]